MTRIALAALALLLAAAPVASAQAHGYHESDNVVYFFAAGSFGSAHLVNHGDDTGPTTMAFDGCALAQLRPEIGGGRVRVVGTIDGVLPIEIDMGGFLSPDGVTPGVSTNLTLDGKYGQDPALKTVPAVAWGQGFIEFGYAPYFEPVGDGLQYAASFYVANDGVRDDDTLALSDKALPGDAEWHLRLQTPASALPQPVQFEFAPAGDLPGLNVFSPNEAYSQRFTFTNPKLGGTATLRLDAVARVPAGMNDLHFTVLAPSGAVLAETDLAPALLADANDELTFPLSEFGSYALEARGKVSMSNYVANVTLAPPAAVDLDFWWENVTYGAQAREDYNQCQKNLGYAQVPGIVVGRDLPPSFLLEIVIVAVVGATAAVLLAVKLVGDSVTFGKFRKQSGR